MAIGSLKLTRIFRANAHSSAALNRAISNSFWLFCDQAFRMFAGLILGIWIARYLGPERYGWLNYAIAIVGVVTSATSLGINSVVVRELVVRPHEARILIGTAFRLRTIGAVMGVVACLLIAWFGAGKDARAGQMIVVVSLGMLLQLGDVMDLLLQARQESRVSAWIRISACFCASLVRVVLLLSGASVVWFAAASVVELGLSSTGWWWLARARNWAYWGWHGEWSRVRALLQESWPAALSGITIYAQAYADQVVIGSTLGGSELGQYAAAIRIVSVFAFVPTVIQTVAAVEVTRAKQESATRYRQRLYDLYRLMTWVFLLVAVPLVILGPITARWLYGQAYAAASVLLPWLALRLLFTNFGVARAIFITNENLFRFALLTAVAGAVTNVALNLILVPVWGAPGAIAASLASFFVTTFALEPLNRRTRQNLWLMVQAIFLPWRLAPQER